MCKGFFSGKQISRNDVSASLESKMPEDNIETIILKLSDDGMKSLAEGVSQYFDVMQEIAAYIEDNEEWNS